LIKESEQHCRDRGVARRADQQGVHRSAGCRTDYCPEDDHDIQRQRSSVR
jgi:hypothetical protein